MFQWMYVSVNWANKYGLRNWSFCLSCLHSVRSPAPKRDVDLSHTGQLTLFISHHCAADESIVANHVGRFHWQQHRNTLRSVRVGMMRGEKGMFSSDVHVRIISSPRQRGNLLKGPCAGDRDGVVLPLCHESTAPLILWPAARPGQLWSSKVASEACL